MWLTVPGDEGMPKVRDTSVWAAFNSHYLLITRGRQEGGGFPWGVCVTRGFLVLTWGVPSMVCV